MAKYCVNCGTKLEDKNNACYNCGTMVGGNVKKNNTKTDDNNYFAISGFVLSLVSTLLCCSLFNLVSLGLSIAGLANSKIYTKGRGLAIAGIIISIIPLLLTIIAFILSILGVFTIPTGGYDI